jgi:hypothetical protein
MRIFGTFSAARSLIALVACACLALAGLVSSPGGTATAVASTGIGVASFQMQAQNEVGASETLAGGHPHSLTASFHLEGTVGGGASQSTPETVREVALDLPPGLVVDSPAAPVCDVDELVSPADTSSCPGPSQVGTLAIEGSGSAQPVEVAVYNIVPVPGQPLELGSDYGGRPLLIHGSYVGAGPAQALRLEMQHIPEVEVIAGMTLTLDDSQDQTGLGASFLTDPFDCSPSPPPARLEVDSWQEPAVYRAAEAPVYPEITGCGALRFAPTLTVQPEATVVDEPSGYTITVDVPRQQSVSEPDTADLKSATVTLPPGLSLSPAAADGLTACSLAEIGLGDEAHLGMCAFSSTIGEAEVQTKLSAQPLQGHLFLGQPECDDGDQPSCGDADAREGRLFRLYLEASLDGTIVKLPGFLSADTATGQLSLTLEGLPQLPIEEVKLHLFGGPRALLANPPRCGSQSASSDLTPWGSPETPDASPSASFSIDWDGVGGSCPGTLPFAPTLSAGMATPTAGVASPFTLQLSRASRQQDLTQFSATLPAGLTWGLSSVSACGEPQASYGGCPAASEVGEMEIAAGVGSHPLWLPGTVYLTGPYRGQQYGLSVVTPLLLGPWDFGTFVVRAAISLDPSSGALTIASDPLPAIVAGMPLRIGAIDLTIDRPGLIVNPIYCAARQIVVTARGTSGAVAQLSEPFATPGCQSPPGGESAPAPVASPPVMSLAKHTATKHPKPKRRKKLHRRRHGHGKRRTRGGRHDRQPRRRAGAGRRRR